MSTAPGDLLAPVRRHLWRLYASLNLAALYEALSAACADLVGCRAVTLLTFQPHARRAQLRFTTNPEVLAHGILGGTTSTKETAPDQGTPAPLREPLGGVAAHGKGLLVFDDGDLCTALRAGGAADAPPGDVLTWVPEGGGPAITAYAVRPLAFEGEPYGGILFHDSAGAPVDPTCLSAQALVGDDEWAGIWLDLIAEAASVALIKCEMDEERSRQLVDSRVRLGAMTRMGQVLNSLDLEVLLQRMMEVALSAVHGQVGSIVLAREGRLQTAVEWGLDHTVAESIRHPSGRSVVQEVFDTRLPALLTRPARDGPAAGGRGGVSIESYLGVPLHTNRSTLGVLNVVNSLGERGFSDRDVDLLVTICNLASAALENALLHEEAMAKERMETQLDIASGIQRSLLPERAPAVSGLDLAGWNQPCEAVGGDYFDFVELGDGRIAVVIGDVSGHGLGPALLMSSCHAALRSLIACRVDHHDIMRHLNRLLTGQVLTSGMFVSMIFGVLDPARRQLVFNNAGHPPPLVLNAGSLSLREPDTRGMVLGVDADVAYPAEAPIRLEGGDLVVFYTDGILDAANARGEHFGKQRLIKTVVAARRLPAADVVEAVRGAITAFCGDCSPADDLTLVLIKVL